MGCSEGEVVHSRQREWGNRDINPLGAFQELQVVIMTEEKVWGRWWQGSPDRR